MDALGCNGAFWGWNLPDIRSKKKRFQSKSKSSDSTAEATSAGGYRFPLKQAVKAASLALTGDTIAQLSDCWRTQKQSLSGSSDAIKTTPSATLLLGGRSRWSTTSLSNVWRVISDDVEDEANDEDDDENRAKMRSPG
ncbi:hypothetical protein QQP08_002764 [Theobroma cacao]|nr:hypothetical protein QQP08_002764 [Theobroma cacao]